MTLPYIYGHGQDRMTILLPVCKLIGAMLVMMPMCPRWGRRAVAVS